MKQRGGKSDLENHISRCYFCKFCKTYRVLHSGHSKACTLEAVAARVRAGLEKGFRTCPICEIPFKNVIEHIQLQHHRSDSEVDKYRLIAARGSTAEEKIANQYRLKAARKKVK